MTIFTLINPFATQSDISCMPYYVIVNMRLMVVVCIDQNHSFVANYVDCLQGQKIVHHNRNECAFHKIKPNSMETK